MNAPQYKWQPRHGKILNDLIVNLNRESIRYFILRNYEGLPEQNNSKDVDIIVEPGYYHKAASCLYNALKNNKVPRYYVVKYERVRCWLAMDLEEDFAIHIDLIEGYLNKGFEVFQFDTLYSYTIVYKNMRVLKDEMDATMLLLYKVIGCKELKDRYKQKIETQYHLHKDEIEGILAQVLYGKVLKNLRENLENSNFDAIIEDAGRISKNSKFKAFFKRPLYTICNVLRFIIEKAYRIVWCPRKFQKVIAVEAPDGTGKSTFIDYLSVKLSEMFVADISKIHIYHFRPNLLPNLGEVGEKASAGKIKQDKDFTNPHRNPPANSISSFIRMTYYWLDYIWGGFIYKRKDVQFDKFTIFDRYIYDFIVDPLRSRIKLPLWLRILFAKCVQHPQIVFILLCDANTVYSRKQELTIEEIDRQMDIYRRLCHMGDFFYQLDASKTPDQMTIDAIKIILNKFTKEIK